MDAIRAVAEEYTEASEATTGNGNRVPNADEMEEKAQNLNDWADSIDSDKSDIEGWTRATTWTRTDHRAIPGTGRMRDLRRAHQAQGRRSLRTIVRPRPHGSLAYRDKGTIVRPTAWTSSWRTRYASGRQHATQLAAYRVATT